MFVSKGWRTFLVDAGLVLGWIASGFYSIGISVNGVSKILLLLLSLGLTLMGCYIWTKIKSRHWGFMFWGILTPIGLLGISLLKDKTAKDLGDKSKQAENTSNL